MAIRGERCAPRRHRVVSRCTRRPGSGIGPLKLENGLADEQVLFLSDILPTGYMGAEMCDIKPGDTVAVWGCGPVGQFATMSAYLLGAERVIGIDRIDYRLEVAREQAHAETVNYETVDSVSEALIEMTAGRGPDACIDAVGMEAPATAPPTSTTEPSKPSGSRRTDPSPSEKPSPRSATAAPYPWWACMAGSSTRFRWVPS